VELPKLITHSFTNPFFNHSCPLLSNLFRNNILKNPQKVLGKNNCDFLSLHNIIFKKYLIYNYI